MQRLQRCVIVNIARAEMCECVVQQHTPFHRRHADCRCRPGLRVESQRRRSRNGQSLSNSTMRTPPLASAPTGNGGRCASTTVSSAGAACISAAGTPATVFLPAATRKAATPRAAAYRQTAHDLPRLRVRPPEFARSAGGRGSRCAADRKVHSRVPAARPEAARDRTALAAARPPPTHRQARACRI